MPSSLRPSRRDWLRLTAVGAVGVSQSGWLGALAADADPKKHKSVILLWMNGGPATIDLWDLKQGHGNGGPFKEIEAVPGLKISEHLPKLAKLGKELAVVRSMATREGDHQRARVVSLTGYTPQGAIQFPAIGALVAHEFDDPKADLPGFVSVGGRLGDIGGGFLGPRYAPFVVGGDRERGGMGAPSVDLKVPDLDRPAGVSTEAHVKRLELLAGLEKDFAPGKAHPVAETMRAATDRAIRLMRPEAAAAFRLEDEKAAVRDTYGRSAFGQGCLLARRLVERGVSFVEVSLDGWDTHNNNFDRVKGLSGTLDTGFAALLSDLKNRGLLDSTLVVCQGEFGRTPKINGQTGRDHWPASWSAVFAGCGVKGGQAVGKTSTDGTQVESDPTRTADLVATVMKAIGLDPTKQNMSNVSRPIRLADPAGKPIKELL
jgi:hypothetical protein